MQVQAGLWEPVLLHRRCASSNMGQWGVAWKMLAIWGNVFWKRFALFFFFMRLFIPNGFLNQAFNVDLSRVYTSSSYQFCGNVHELVLSLLGKLCFWPQQVSLASHYPLSFDLGCNHTSYLRNSASSVHKKRRLAVFRQPWYQVMLISCLVTAIS